MQSLTETVPLKVPPRIPPTPLLDEVISPSLIQAWIVGDDLLPVLPTIPPKYFPIPDTLPTFLHDSKVDVEVAPPVIPPTYTSPEVIDLTSP